MAHDAVRQCAVDGAAADMAAQSLEERGFASLAVATSTASTAAHAFAIARSALDVLEDGPPPLGPHTTDTANASGSHRAGALSSYNACREGFVFSNGASFSVHGVDGFEAAMSAFFNVAMEAAHAVLAAIERRLQLPLHWFETALGPLSEHAQWHMKRYVPESAPRHAVTTDGKLVLLAVHSDPSLISLVFHDAPGRQPGAMGLECQVTKDGQSTWEPVSSHGHEVVTVLCGSIMEKLTGRVLGAVRHRVAMPSEAALETQSGRRVAATFFFRPAPSAFLQPPPSPLLPRARGPPIQYSAWLRKVASRYERHAPPAVFAKAAPSPVANGSQGEGPPAAITFSVRVTEGDDGRAALDARIRPL